MLSENVLQRKKYLEYKRRQEMTPVNKDGEGTRKIKNEPSSFFDPNKCERPFNMNKLDWAIKLDYHML